MKEYKNQNWNKKSWDLISFVSVKAGINQEIKQCLETAQQGVLWKICRSQEILKRTTIRTCNTNVRRILLCTRTTQHFVNICPKMILEYSSQNTYQTRNSNYTKQMELVKTTGREKEDLHILAINNCSKNIQIYHEATWIYLWKHLKKWKGIVEEMRRL